MQLKDWLCAGQDEGIVQWFAYLYYIKTDGEMCTIVFKSHP